MGLGRHVVNRIVEARDGQIRFTSREGRGTRFEVRFPLAKAGPASAAPALDARASPVPSPASGRR